jgi:hypothetical protein
MTSRVSAAGLEFYDWMSYVALGVLIIVAVSLLLALGGAGVILVRSFVTHVNTVTPETYRDERRGTRDLKPGEFPADLAYPAYPRRQLRADAEAIKANYTLVSGELWHWPRDAFLEGRHGPQLLWWMAFPIPLVGLGMQPLLQALLGILVLLMLLAAGIVRVVGSLAFWVVVCVLRTADAVWARSRGAAASCPRCYHVSERPAYTCPGCHRLHRDIRSGRLGAFARRCRCGHLLPATVIRAAWALEARCQRCEEPLRRGAAVLRDVRIPIFGDPNSGKSRFLYAGLNSLYGTAGRSNMEYAFVDAGSQAAAESGFELIRMAQDTVKTTEDLPRALTVRIGAEPTGALVHLFDAAGERFRRPEAHDEMGFLDQGQCFVFVIDPFSVGQLRARLSQTEASVLVAHPAVGDPESTYGEVVTRIRSGGIKGKHQRLAVVVSKADLLERSGADVPNGSDALAEWLYDLGLHNIVLGARRDFAEVRYYAVASVDPSTVGLARDPGAPLRWLLSSRGVRLEERADTVLATAAEGER